ncbi:hypothetical protein J8M20_22950 [Pseudoalteromonas luteoviolacea]|uniref:hypothetical protein n=1 Tax=Pseudoalteromonas luteoviolacea TaxID=43657 RepID=UPI001B371F09|nr:hypothetical protein [Pseudoalteromonas luteoviolacea]MBQ4814244.1 hypothetical protein [Pseudoalteromonas luteoviolacea]
MTWFNSANSNATNGSNIIKINDNQSVANIRTSDALVLGAFAPVEIAKAYVTTHGTFVELIKPWPNATQNQVPCVVLPTSGDFNTAVSALNNASKMVNDNYKAMIDWQTKTGSVQFSDLEGNTQTVKTLRQMQSEIDTANPYPWAMRKVEFEARRQQNLDRYAASGFVHFGKHLESANTINEGLWARATEPNVLRLGASSLNAGTSKTDEPVLHMAGVIVHLTQLCNTDEAFNAIKLPAAEAGLRTYDSTTGLSVTHSSPDVAFASETNTNKVVTERSDMFGFELFLREINDTDPFVYKHGILQSQSSNINGVATITDTARPATYFAWFEGDETSIGKGVNWIQANEMQRIAIASDPKNNLYFDDLTGKFYQWCVRGRCFAGQGNGDWAALNSQHSYCGFSVSNRVATQGIKDSGASFTHQASLSFNSGTNAAAYSAKNHNIGIFSNKSPIFSNNGESYFLVCGTINRLNKGAYHPSFNAVGAAQFWNKDNTVNGSAKWFSAHSKRVSNKAQCFDFGDFGSSSYTNADFGKIGNTHTNARPDGRCYDAIYANGFGGACRDMRYSAHSLTISNINGVDLEVKSGQYRGLQTCPFTQIFTSVNEVPSGFTIINQDTPTAIVAQTTMGPSVSGSIPHIDVFGPPTSILQCSDLKRGWYGHWVPNSLQGNAAANLHLSRPATNILSGILTNDTGATWQTWSPTLDSINNTIYLSADMASSQHIYLVYYHAQATMTIQANNQRAASLIQPRSVFVTDSCEPHSGRDLLYSLTNSVGASTTAHNKAIGYAALSIPLNPLSSITHTPISHTAPSNNSKGVKALSYFVVQNNQVFINFAYTQLIHNGSNWGDDNTVYMTDGQQTRLDANDQEVIYGTAQLVEPLGWIK